MVEKSEKTSIVIPDNLMKFLDKNGWPTLLNGLPRSRSADTLKLSLHISWLNGNVGTLC